MYLFKKRRRNQVLSIPLTKWFKDSIVTLTEAEQKELCHRLKNGDKTVVPRLAASFYMIAIYIASQYAPYRANYTEDLLSEALLGITIALDEIHTMYDDNIRPFVMSKIQTRCSNYFNKSDRSLGCHSEKYNRAVSGDHRLIRTIGASPLLLELFLEEQSNYKDTLDDLKVSANTKRRREILDLFLKGFDRHDITSILCISKSTLSREIGEIEYNYYSILALRTQEDRSYANV